MKHQTSINEEVTDMVGEITNMVTGGFPKRILGEKGMILIWQHPLSSLALNTISHKGNAPKILMPFESEFGNATIEICFE